jgi:cell division protein FtsB
MSFYRELINIIKKPFYSEHYWEKQYHIIFHKNKRTVTALNAKIDELAARNLRLEGEVHNLREEVSAIFKTEQM